MRLAKAVAEKANMPRIIIVTIIAYLPLMGAIMPPVVG